MTEGRDIDGNTLIAASGIDVGVGGGAILKDAGAEVGEGEIVTLIGPNGAGKTTLLRVMLGLQRPLAGRVFRRPGLSIGYMPQHFAVDPTLPLTVRRFLELALPRSAGNAGQAIGRALAEVGAGGVLENPVQEVSGGEMRRVLLARALLRDPGLLVLDEPAQGVDVTGQADLYRLIGELRRRRRCGVLLVSHDLHLVMAATDRVICLNRHVCCAGRPETVTRDPAYVELFGEQAARAFAFYQHHHDHRHHADGRVVPLDGDAGTEDPPHG